MMESGSAVLVREKNVLLMESLLVISANINGYTRLFQIELFCFIGIAMQEIIGEIMFHSFFIPYYL